MATFVLVHGGFAGGWIWCKVRSLLRDADHEVYAPTLTGLGERSHLANPDIDLMVHVQDERCRLEPILFQIGRRRSAMVHSYCV